MIGYKSNRSLYLSIYVVVQRNKHAFGAEENPVSLLVHQNHWKVNACPCALVVGHSSCFPHFSRKASVSPDFTGINFENGCCRPIFGHVYPEIKK